MGRAHVMQVVGDADSDASDGVGHCHTMAHRMIRLGTPAVPRARRGPMAAGGKPRTVVRVMFGAARRAAGTHRSGGNAASRAASIAQLHSNDGDAHVVANIEVASASLHLCCGRLAQRARRNTLASAGGRRRSCIITPHHSTLCPRWLRIPPPWRRPQQLPSQSLQRP